ncbi:MAG: protein-L-isoaspartate(D-aspartate) O-methyltransferase [Patescibacteria group bacterium]
MNKLISDLIKNGYLKSDSIIDAFSKVNRVEFVTDDMESQADVDVALPIGYGQTISQPLTVAFMLELLDPRDGQIILDVGMGSGWTTALLAEIVGKAGKVIAVERIKELMERGKKNVDKYNYVGRGIAEFYLADGSRGLPQKAPFDRILVSASSPSIPQPLKDQLKIGGKMVLPVRNSIFYLEKKSEQEFFQEEFPGFSFVPLINENK